MPDKSSTANQQRSGKTSLRTSAARTSATSTSSKEQQPVAAPDAASQILQQAALDPQVMSPHALLQLQRRLGNQAVQRLLATRTLQAKLTVGAADDEYEQEADRVAAQVMRLPDAEEEEIQAKPLASAITPTARRIPQIEDEEELQTKRATAAESFDTGADFESRLSATRGSGSPLPDTVREFMEPRFGADFSSVRLHTGSESAQLNREVSAQAFTLGSDIYLGEGKTDVESSAGKQLLAHELTHVVQQSSGIVRRQIGLAGDGKMVREKSTGQTYRAQWNQKWQAYDLFSVSGYVMQVKPNDADYEIMGEEDDEQGMEVSDHVDGGTAVTEILKFLKANMRSDSNYCVALLDNDDIIISKVNGVTDKTDKMDDLQQKIEDENLEVERSIYLAQKYNTALGSNHAEMCILAAAKAMGAKVTEMGCTGPNCPYCAAMLEHEGVNSRNAGQDGKAQQGWAHPTEPIFWGSQVNNASVSEQVKDLKSFLAGNEPQIGKRTINQSQGKYTKWL